MDRTAKVSDLTAKLSRCLAHVRNGETVTVCDRKTPIARFVPVSETAGRIRVREAIDTESLPVGPRNDLEEPIQVVTQLRADRAER